MHSRPLMVVRFVTSATEEVGSTPRGQLSIFPITGGSFEGERLRDDANHYLRTLPRFETAAPKYAFLNRRLAVGIGEGPVHAIEEIR